MNTLQVEPDSSPKKSINYNIRRTYYKLHNTDDLKQKQPRIEDWDVTEKQKKFLIKCRETYNKDLTGDKKQQKPTDLSFLRSDKLTRKSLLGLKRTTSRLGSQFRDFRDSIRRPSRLYSRFGHQDYSVYRHSKDDVNHAKKKELSDFERHFTDKELKALGDKTAFIHPRSTFRIYWEILTIIPTLLSIIFVPIEFAFCNQWTSTPEYNFFLMFMPIDTWFLVDMILNYHTGYVDKKRKIIVMNKTLVTRHYLHSVQIFIDFLTSVPLDIIFNLFAYYVEILLPGTHIRTWLSPDGLRMLRLIKILRYFRGMKYIFRTVELVGKQYEQALAIFRFTKIFMTIVITVHILGITQWSIPMLYSFPEDSWPVRANIVKAGATSYKFISETRFTNEHDAKQFVEIVGPVNFEQHEWQTIYWWCLIKALSQTLTLAYGTAPHCTPEIIITMICMLIGALLWGILLGNLINFFQSQHVNQDTYNLKMREVVSYANFKSLPLVSKQLIFKFFEMRWLGKVFNEEEILQELSPVLRRKVLQFTRLDYIRRSPIFRDCSTQFLLEISYCMKDELYMPNQLVASIGRQCETIIVPYQGELLQYIPTLDIMEVVKVGMLLGECSIIRREFWNGEVYSLGWTRAYILNPVDVKDIGRMFPKDYLKILRNFKKSMGLVDDLPFINDINDKLEDLREQLRQNDLEARERAAFDMNDQHFTMRQSLAKNVKKMMRGHGYNTETDDYMTAPKQSNFTSSMFQSNKKDDTSMLWNDRHMSFNNDPRSDLNMSMNKGRVSNINMLTQQPKVQKEDSDDDSHSHQSYRPSSFQLLEDLKEEDEEEEEFQKLQADEKRKREAKKEGLVPQLTIDNGSIGRNSTASVLYGVNSQFDLENKLSDSSIAPLREKSLMKPAKSRVSKLSMRGAASRLSVARSFIERRKSKADDDQETLGGFNPSVVSKQKPALLAQSNMLQTMLISRSSMALSKIGAGKFDANEDHSIEIFAKNAEQERKSMSQQRRTTVRQGSKFSALPRNTRQSVFARPTDINVEDDESGRTSVFQKPANFDAEEALKREAGRQTVLDPSAFVKKRRGTITDSGPAAFLNKGISFSETAEINNVIAQFANPNARRRMSKMQRRNTLVNYNPLFDTEKDEPKHVEMSSKTASKFAEFANRVKIANMFLNTPSNPVATESDMGFDTVHEANESRDMPKPRVTASKPEITNNLMKKLIQQPKVETIDEAGPDTKMQSSS